MTVTSAPVLQIDALTLSYRVGNEWLRAVRELSLSLTSGEALAIVGESGSGKSSTAQAAMQMLPRGGRFDAGRVTIGDVDVRTVGARGLRALRGRVVGYVPQQPMTAFNPTVRIGRQVAESLVVHEHTRYRDTLDRVRQSLLDVGLKDPGRVIDAYPHQLSGGMLQRAMIASAIIARPALLIADEPTSALDVTVQRQILGLLRRIREEHRLSVLLISHDLSAVSQLADRCLVMYGGRGVETGETEVLLSRPRHPYTRGLVASSPGRGQPHKSRLSSMPGAPLEAREVETIQGCPFESRCSRAIPVCAERFPEPSGDARQRWCCHNPLEAL